MVLSPFAPHLAAELWEKLGQNFQHSLGEIDAQTWPEFDPALLIEDEVEIILQVNGKVRDRVRAPVNAPNEQLEQIALANPRVQEFIAGKTVRKIIVVQNKLVNVVAN